MQNREAAPGLRRNVWIDGLRGFCIFSVLCSHGVFRFHPPGAPPDWYSSIFLGKGYFGVATFFVISGFLITTNTLRRYGRPAGVDFGQFYAMRAARILPGLLLFIAIMVPLGYAGFSMYTPADKHLLWASAYAALTFQYNSHYLVANVPGLYHWAPLWSLSIEEIFYLTFPLVCFLTRSRTALITLLLALVLGGPFARREFTGIFSFWGAADLLGSGCLTAIAVDHFRPRLAAFHWPLLATGSAILLYIFTCYKPRENFTLVPTLLGLGAALFLMGAAVAPIVERPNFAVAAIATLGRISYEIYIFHVAIILVLNPACLDLVQRLGAPEFAANLITSVVVLTVVYWICSAVSRYITEPLNVRIRRFYAE